MAYFTTRKQFLMPSFDPEAKEREKLDKFLAMLERSGVGEVLQRTKDDLKPEGGRPRFNRYNMFATVLYGFAFGASTLRELESACRNDLRFIYLMEQERPSYSSFCHYINTFIVPNTEEIFACVVIEILKECGIELDDAFIDGTKIEAFANKYKFVWKPTTWHLHLCDKVRTLLKQHDLEKNVPASGIFSSSIIAKKLSDFSRLCDTCEDEKQKKILTRHNVQLQNYLAKAMEYEEKESICGPDRNSYYKTDHDATAMCLKEDYYSGLGSNMHAAYNAQVVVIKGFACAYYVSHSRSDMNDFIPALDAFFRIHHQYPVNLCADSGYGSLANYRYLNQHNIGNYVKYQSWNGNVSGNRPDPYHLNDDLSITCLNGNNGKQIELDNRHPKNAGAVFYQVTGCLSCQYASYCKRFMNDKDEDFRIFEVNIEYQKYRNQATRNLLSPKGIEIRVNRSIQNEGAFGALKQDMEYIRFRRRSIEKVTAEYMLTFLGFNVRKLFRYYSGNLKMSFWTAPEDLQAETFAKPRAKILARKVMAKKKSVNEQARSSYRKKEGVDNLAVNL